MNLIQAMGTMQKHISSLPESNENKDVPEAWNCIRDQTTKMLGSMMTIREIMATDTICDEVANSLKE